MAMHETLSNKFKEAFPQLGIRSEKLLQGIISSAHISVCAPNTQIYFAGDSCSHIAFILRGDIRVFKNSVCGREITLYEIGPGETCILNASCILSNIKYPAGAITLIETELLMVPASNLRQLIDEHEEMRTFIFTLLSHRLTDVMTLVEEVVFGKLDQRLIDYLIEKAEDSKIITTHQTIANNLGTSREVISRLLKVLENKHVISLSRNLITLAPGQK